MPRTIAWNAQGNTLLTAAQRTTVEGVANSARRDQTVPLLVGAPAALQVTLQGTSVVLDGTIVGTMTGTPPGPPGTGS